MKNKQLRFAIFGNEYQTKNLETVQRILNTLQHKGAEVIIDGEFLDFLLSEQVEVYGAEGFCGDEFSAHFAISMGGDGTLLKAAARVGGKGIPLVGINLGRLGFLAATMPTEIEEAVEALYRGDYTLSSHSVIEAVIDGEGGKTVTYALNDISILKRDTAAMISIEAQIDGDYMATYQADGLVICTPTGSTAYNLSNGGPIIAPTATVLCLTPVAPHSLNVRPVVLDGRSVVTLNVESRSRNFLVAADGKSDTYCQGAHISISTAPFSIKIVKLPGKNYYTTLREKMMWGADQRG